MAGPLLRAPEAELRRDRTSVKWVAFDPDVLPALGRRDGRRALPGRRRGGDRRRAAWRHRLRVGTALRRRRWRGTRHHAWGWEVDPAAARVVPDVMIGVAELLRLLTDEGGPVVVSPPVYDSFFGFVDAIGRRRVDAPLTAAGRLDPGRSRRPSGRRRHRGERAAYLLCNPQNPTGTVHSPAELEALASLARAARRARRRRRDPRAGRVRGGRGFTPFLTVPGAERGFSVFSPSKGWNLAGLKSALAVAGPGASRRAAAARGAHARLVAPRRDRARRGHGRRAPVAGPAARRARRQPARCWAACSPSTCPDVRWLAPEATYLAWLDCRALGLGDDPAAVFRRRGRVALASGPRYGADAGRGFARLNFATSPEVARGRRAADGVLPLTRPQPGGGAGSAPRPAARTGPSSRRRAPTSRPAPRGPRHHGDEPVRRAASPGAAR